MISFTSQETGLDFDNPMEMLHACHHSITARACNAPPKEHDAAECGVKTMPKSYKGHYRRLAAQFEGEEAIQISHLYFLMRQLTGGEI